MEAHPHAAWLVLACDMPLVEISTLQALCTHRDPTQQATVFYHPETHQPEPLCALYEPTLLPALRQHQEQGQYSLRAIISQVAHHVVRSPQKKALDSCNDPVSHQQMRALLQKDFPKSYS
jgi:molybdopterin-guanine dinucleotide biosynthesis protein A